MCILKPGVIKQHKTQSLPFYIGPVSSFLMSRRKIVMSFQTLLTSSIPLLRLSVLDAQCGSLPLVSLRHCMFNTKYAYPAETEDDLHSFLPTGLLPHDDDDLINIFKDGDDITKEPEEGDENTKTKGLDDEDDQQIVDSLLSSNIDTQLDKEMDLEEIDTSVIEDVFKGVLGTASPTTGKGFAFYAMLPFVHAFL